ncbi:class D sortase [Lentibacillus kapialis]|uniref:Class D sortase n=1 Tax=Lentibacillus kapialis TaxID=340214 RepID=A0A917PZM3_9BACI|nr:class D sortase [Lentibacillus kapialis]GGK02300.1 class D sortase [Lentibacillus kapialis]
MIRKLSILLFAIGFIVFVYNGWSYFQATQSVQQIPEKTEEENVDIENKEKETEEDNPDSTYHDVNPRSLNFDNKKGTEVAMLDIPKMDKRFTTYWGTNEKSLDQGVGMYVSKWTTVPNHKTGHTVLSGHRDTVFTGLDELGQGDMLEVHYNDEAYEYEITTTWITDADDRSVIVEKEEPTLTLTTCYPFDYIGYAPNRYIVQATLVE